MYYIVQSQTERSIIVIYRAGLPGMEYSCHVTYCSFIHSFTLEVSKHEVHRSEDKHSTDFKSRQINSFHSKLDARSYLH